MGRPRNKPATVESIEVPRSFIAFFERRTEGIVRESLRSGTMSGVNVLRSIALSCYQQGLIDGADAVSQRAAVPKEQP